MYVMPPEHPQDSYICKHEYELPYWCCERPELEVPARLPHSRQQHSHDSYGKIYEPNLRKRRNEGSSCRMSRRLQDDQGTT